MSKLLLYVVIFFVGVLLAFPMTFRPQFLNPAGTPSAFQRIEQSLHFNEAAPPPGAAPAAGGDRAPGKLRAAFPDDDAGQSAGETAFPPGGRRSGNVEDKQYRKQMLINAVKDGTRESLEQLRADYIDFLPEYRDELLPALRRQVLVTLIERFDEDDWLSWGRVQRSAAQSSLARTFLDDLEHVNAPLGKYAETAALVFTRLYTKTMAGAVYTLEDDLHHIIQRAEELVPRKRPMAVPARFSLEPGIARDHVFRAVFEQLRGNLTVVYASRNPDKLQNRLQHLLALQPKFCEPAVVQAAIDWLSEAAAASSRKFRAQAAQEMVKHGALAELAAIEPQFQLALAQFYLIAAVDAVEDTEWDRAQGLVDLSQQVRPNLAAQGLVQTYIRDRQNLREQVARLRGKDAGEEADEELVKEQPVAAKSRKSGPWAASVSKFDYQQLLIYLTLIGVAIFVGTRLMLLVMGRRALQQSVVRSIPAEDASSFSITRPSDIEFEEEPELRVVANR